MAGYRDHSMSNNAVAAYEEGEKPLSRWNKAGILKEIEASEAFTAEQLAELRTWKAADLKDYLKKSSWHHTSAKYNRTTFYSVDISRLLAFFKYRNTYIALLPNKYTAVGYVDRNAGTFTTLDGIAYNLKEVIL